MLSNQLENRRTISKDYRWRSLPRVNQELQSPVLSGYSERMRLSTPDSESSCNRWLAPLLGALFTLGGCPSSRELPPPPVEEAPKPRPPACEKVFHDPGAHTSASRCCNGPSSEVLKKADVLSTCGRTDAEYAGETQDGGECQFHFQLGGAANANLIAINRPLIPPGTPAPVIPDPLLPWSWKKIQLRDAIGFVVKEAPRHPEMLEQQYTFWAARGRHVIGMKIAKKVCSEPQALALLQKAIDAPH